MLNFAISWIQCPHNEISNNNCVNFKKSRSQCVSLTEKVLHKNDIINLNNSQVGFVQSFCMEKKQKKQGKSDGVDSCDQPSNLTQTWFKLEQLERLRSEDSPRCLMITHTIESCWIPPSQNKVEWPWRYRSRSKVMTCNTPPHASDHLYQIWKESIQNCRRYRVNTIFKV